MTTQWELPQQSPQGTQQALWRQQHRTVAIYPLSGIVYVKCMAIASNVTKFGLPLYTSQTGDTNGLCDDDSSNSATLIGYYAGEDGLTITEGDLVPVFVVGHN